MPAVRSSQPPPASPAPTPVLVPVGSHKGQQPLSLGRTVTLIGSTAASRLYLPSKAVSRCHAVIINTGAGLFVRDLASRTGTRVNGQLVTEADLREGDVLQVGTFTFRFTDPTAPPVRPPAPPAPPAVLEVDELDEPLPLTGRATLIGRRETADISLTENAASSAHTLLFVAGGKHLLRDLNSRTGTFVNGVKVHEHSLESGDVLKAGETTFRYVRQGAAQAKPAEKAAAPKVEEPAPLDSVPIEVAPLIESEPPSPQPPERPDTQSHDGNGNGGGIGLLEMGERNGGDEPDAAAPSPAPSDVIPRDTSEGQEIPLAPMEPPRD